MENKGIIKQFLTKEDVLTIEELKTFIKDIPDDTEVWCYAVGFNESNSWTSDSVGLTYQNNRLFIDFNNMG